MLESIKRKEREYAIAEVKKQLKKEQEYIATYGGSELLSMEDDSTKGEREAEDLITYNAKRRDINSINSNSGEERKLDPFAEMNHDAHAELLKTREAQASSSSSSSSTTDEHSSNQESVVITAAPKLNQEAQRLEELRQQKLREQREDEEKKSKEEDEERKRKRELYDEQSILPAGRKTKLKFGLGKKLSL